MEAEESARMPSPDAARVRCFVQNLNQTDRYLVLLHFADELSEMEIAAVLQLEPHTVRRRLGELRQQLAGITARPAASPRGEAISTTRPDAGPRAAAFA
jgi:DNA-directed RNA polymerase specialized sigma24 family protein